MLHKPSLKVCLTDEEMFELREQCKEFCREARAVCGKAISIEKILNDKKNCRWEKFKMAEEASIRNLLQWRHEQEVRRIEMNLKREIQNQGLQEELRRIEESKMLKRMKEIQAEKNYLEEVEEVEAIHLEREQVELKKRIKVYEKLNLNVDKELKRNAEIVADLKVCLDNNQKKDEKLDELKTVEDKIASPTKFTAKIASPIKSTAKIASPTISPTKTSSKSVEDSLNANEPVTTKLHQTDEMNNFIPKTALTEAQRNRIKVLSHEYNLTTDEANGNIIAVTSTVEKTLTDGQKNKLKMMSHDFSYSEELTAPKISVTMTDLQRNRLKVLSHEYNIETEIPEKKMSLNLLQIEPVQHLESPMSVTSDHFNDCDSTQKESPEESSEIEKSQVIQDDEDLEMLKAFENALEKNRSTFLGINLNDLAMESKMSYEHIKTTDTMALSRFLQMSLMVPVNSYMEILNNETLKMFVNDLDILSHFKSMRNYFLLMNGEFSISICQKLFSKLESGVRPEELLNYQSLHMILDHALSRSRNDTNTEQLSFIVQNIPEKFELHSPAVLNMLTMSYKLEWPLTLILNPETIEQYQAIFNYLLKLKRISWVLEECFQILKEQHKKYGRDLLRSPQYRCVQQIRHKMTHFVHCLENYVTRNVLQISWNAFVEDLKSAQSIHGIYRKHTNYLKRVLFLCLLNKKSIEFQKAIEGTFKVILKFHK